jgi:polyhydroxybutyrate depolymerase
MTEPAGRSRKSSGGALTAAALLGGVVAIVVAVLAIALPAAGGSAGRGGGGPGSSPDGSQTVTATVPNNGDVDSATVVGPRPKPIVYRPAGLSRSKPVPLVLAFYGATGTPQRMEGVTKFEELANTRGFVVVYPGSGTNPPWHDANNVSYIRSLIHRVSAKENIDPNRIYLAGFSAGGRETYFLGCELSNLVAGIAVVSGIMRPYPCTLAHPVSELTLDESGLAAGSSTIPSADSVAARWRSLDGCPAKQAPVTGTVTSVKTQSWGPCKGGSAVAVWAVQGGKHTWPGTYGLAPGSPDARFDASSAIWGFFAAHPLRG